MRPPTDANLAALDRAVARYEQSVDLAGAYLNSRGIGKLTAASFRLGVVVEPATGHEMMAGRLAIPSLGHDGRPYAIRFRTITDEEPKYLGLPGEPTRPFNLRAVHEAGDVIAICEGEIDAITMEMCGVPAVGITGANNWKRHHPRVFAGFRTVYVIGDGDQAGREFSRTVVGSLRSGRSCFVNEGMDVNSIFVEGGREAVLKLLEG